MIPTNVETPQSDCILFDFTAYARKVPVKKINDNGGSLLTFGDLFSHLLRTFISFQDKCNTIHIMFDMYRTQSVKDLTQKNKLADKC